jgi:hypothetical protein
MKTKLLFFISLLSILKGAAQIDFIIPETWEIDSWNGTGWTNSALVTYSFNNACFVTQALSQTRDPDTGVLENNILLTITNNSSNQQIEGVNEFWNGVGWDNYQRFEHTYNSNDDIVETKNYDWESDAWELKNRDVYTYVSPGFPSKVTHQGWDAVNTEWDNVMETRYTYSGTGKILTEYRYNWNTTNNIWDTESRNINTYNSNDLLESKEHDEWKSTSWEHNFLLSYTYDSNNHIKIELTSDWNGTSYEVKSQQLYTTNGDGYPTSIVSQAYVLGTWFNAARDTRTYPTCSGLSVKGFDTYIVELYPNPAKEIVNINLESNASFQLIGLNGQVLQKGKLIRGDNKINISQLLSGLYFLNIKTEQEIISKKIIKQ